MAPLTPTLAPVLNDACPTCGALMAPSRAALQIPVNRQPITISDIPHVRCPNCGEQVLTTAQASRLEQAAVASYRGQHGLLSGEEVRHIRDRHGMTAAEFAKLLRVAAGTIAAWEANTHAQTSAQDMLLRMVRDVPGSVDYLRHHAA